MGIYLQEVASHYQGHLSLLEGDGVTVSERRIGDLAGVFEDEDQRKRMDQSQLVYRVFSHAAVPEGTRGGLLFGISTIYPGRVGNEYFMTKGHFHARRETAEYYWGLAGMGVLLLMDEEGKCRAERVCPGSLHYIPGHVAHRLINTGDEVLSVGACWPSDAGHDYGAIQREGFTARVVEQDGIVAVVERTGDKR